MKKIILMVFSFIFCSSIAMSQTVTDTLMLSLDSCVSMAIRNSYEVRIASETIEKAKAEKNAILSAYFPKISGTAIGGYMFKDIELLNSIDPLLPSFSINGTSLPTSITEPLNQALNSLRQEIVNGWKPIDLSLKGAFVAGITLQQPIFAGGRIITGNKMAKIGTEMAAENKRLKEAQANIEAQKAYWLYLSVREKVKLAQTYVHLLEMVEQQVNNVEEVNMIDMNSLMHVRVKQSEVKMQLQRAQSGLVLSRMALCQIIGVPYSTYIIATDSAIQTDIILLPAENYNIEDRPEYKLLEKSVQLKQGEIQLARGNYLPTVGLGAAYAYMGNVSIGGQTDPPYNISNIMATVNVPITHWWEGSQKIKSAKREKNIAQLELEKNSELMQLQIQQTIFNLQDSYQQIKIAEEALKANEENLRINQDKYELQMQTLTQLLEAQGSWQQAYSNLIDAKIEYRIAIIEYLQAIGNLQ